MRSLPRIEVLPAVVRRPSDLDTGALTGEILEEVRAVGEPAIRRFSEHFGDLAPGDRIIHDRRDLEQSLDRIGPDEPRHWRELRRGSSTLPRHSERRWSMSMSR